MELDFQAIFQTIGLGGIFLFLFIRERELSKNLMQSHIDDLREIAGLRQNLSRVTSIVASSTSGGNGGSNGGNHKT